MKNIFCFLFVLMNFFSDAQVTSSKNTSSIYPAGEWQYIKDPSVQGWDAIKLAALKTFIADSSKRTGMMVIQHGNVIFHYGDIAELSYIGSARKSVLAMLYGPFVANGTIDLNKTLEQLGIDDLGGLLPIEKKAGGKGKDALHYE